MFGLMRLEQFHNDTIALRHQCKNHKHDIPQGIMDNIDVIMEPIYVHIQQMKKKDNFDLPLAQRWAYGCSDGKSNVRNGFESLRFNLLELIELYSRCSM